MAVLKLQHVYKRYDNAQSSLFKKKVKNGFAVDDLSFECRDGEFLGILGPSGCGKSTTLRMIAGLEKITDGEIYIGDVLINDLQPKDRSIGLAFEDYALYPPLTVYDNLAFNLRAKHVPEAEVKQSVERIAKLMKVEQLLKMRPHGLSGGQKQRVNIARGFIVDYPILLLDEPTASLDAKNSAAVVELIREAKARGAAIVGIFHDETVREQVADRLHPMGVSS